MLYFLLVLGYILAFGEANSSWASIKTEGYNYTALVVTTILSEQHFVSVPCPGTTCKCPATFSP